MGVILLGNKHKIACWWSIPLKKRSFALHSFLEKGGRDHDSNPFQGSGIAWLNFHFYYAGSEYCVEYVQKV